MRSPAISVPTGMNGIQQWCRVTVVGPDGAELAFCRLVGPGAPDPWGGGRRGPSGATGGAPRR
jgi:hypothetical protein